MAVYALARVGHFRDGRLSVGEIRAGMLDSARWVERRGRHGERLDSQEWLWPRGDFDADQLESPSDHGNEGHAAQPRRLNLREYLVVALGRELSEATSTVVDEAWLIARDHFVWLIEVSGLDGPALVAAAQARSGVNRSRRLVNRLPLGWPPATRKAVGLLFTGSPALGDGVVVWWATTPPERVPANLRCSWSGLLAVVDPGVGVMSEVARRQRREHARRGVRSVLDASEIAV
jgi:hypothetical protein